MLNIPAVIPAFPLGPGELLLIFAILVLVFGASRLPQLGEAVGKSVRSLKRGLNTDDDIDVSPKQVSDTANEPKVGAKDVADAEIVEHK